MSHWLYPANTKFYDVVAAFGATITYWPMSSKVEVGDIVYVYLAAPQKQIAFIAEVLEIDIEESNVLDNVRKFFKKEPESRDNKKSFMKLKTSKAFEIEEESKLAYSHLKQNGLNGMLMGPRKLENNLPLLDYIQENV